MGNELNFCQGCNEVFNDGKSLGENNLTQRQNAPITNIKNPFFFNNNKTSASILEPKTNNESFINNNQKVETVLTTLNNPLPVEEEQKITKAITERNKVDPLNSNYNKSTVKMSGFNININPNLNKNENSNMKNSQNLEINNNINNNENTYKKQNYYMNSNENDESNKFLNINNTSNPEINQNYGIINISNPDINQNFIIYQNPAINQNNENNNLEKYNENQNIYVNKSENPQLNNINYINNGLNPEQKIIKNKSENPIIAQKFINDKPDNSEIEKNIFMNFNRNNINNNSNNNNNNIISFNNMINNNEIVSADFTKENIEEVSARKITKLFRKFVKMKREAHHKLYKDIYEIPLSFYIKDLDHSKLDVNLAPDQKCIYLGTKFNNRKDGLGLELFNNSKAKYFGIFSDGRRINSGMFCIKNKEKEYKYYGNIFGIYAWGYGWVKDKKEKKLYEGMWEKSMKNGYGIEKYGDKSVYKGCFVNGKKEGIGFYKWKDNSTYQGEFKDNNFDGYGIYKSGDGYEYKGEWKKSKFHGYGEYTIPKTKKYIGFFEKDKRCGFGIEIRPQEEKAFIGFWKNNNAYGYGKYIVGNKKQYGIYKGGKVIEKFKKGDFMKKIKNKYKNYLDFFQIAFFRHMQTRLINRNWHNFFAGVKSFALQLASFLQNVIVNLNDESILFKQRNKFAGRHKAGSRTNPTDKSFCADNFSRLNVVLRLIPRFEFIIFKCANHTVFNVVFTFQSLFHFLIKDFHFIA